MKRIVKLVPALALFLFLPACESLPPAGGTPPPPCLEGHIWGDGINAYHLGHDALSPVLANKSSYEPDVESWNDLGTPITLLTEGEGFSLTVVDGGDRQSGWLGLASIEIDSAGHIQSGEVTMNKSILDDYTTRTAAHVLCQEIGHLLGLEHNRTLDLDFGTTPNDHDGETLNEVYAHAADPPIPPCSSGTVILHTFDVVVPDPTEE